MKKMNGFTLIELLAVIVILAIIAVIATPLAINVINDSREKSFINSTYGLIDGVKLLSSEQVFDDGSNEVVVNFTDGIADNTNFRVSGDMPTSGTIHLKTDGKVELKVWSEELGKCAEKSATEAEVKLTETTKENCKLEVKVDSTTGQTVREVMESKISIGETAYDGTVDNNLRYVGPAPNNYVKFNGDERWRIIGVFHDEEKGDQIKIIREQLYNNTTIAWNDNSDESYENNWETSSLKALLNDGDTGYLKLIENNDSTSYNYIDVDHVWNIGGTPSWDSSTRSDLYSAERSETKSSVMTSHLWEGAIGLMYPSDYGYASSGNTETCDNTVMSNWRENTDATAFEECAKNSWLYYNGSGSQWTLTPLSDYVNRVFYADGRGMVSHDYAGRNYVARPTLFLKSTTKIVGGLGTFDQPFELGV